MPCWWPEAILCAPCLCAFCHSANEALKTTVYVLTDKRLYQSIDTPQKAPNPNPSLSPGPGPNLNPNPNPNPN